MSYQTFRNRRLRADLRFPPPVNPGRRKPLYDRAQVEAYRDGRELPALPESSHAEDPDDLLDELDVADLYGVAHATVRADKATGRLPPPLRVYGVTHWPRSEVLAARAARPGRGVGGGRPRKGRNHAGEWREGAHEAERRKKDPPFELGDHARTSRHVRRG